ncbi:hypothetical protein JCM8202_000645 [Rhodotorula sphaerocarpa]
MEHLQSSPAEAVKQNARVRQQPLRFRQDHGVVVEPPAGPAAAPARSTRSGGARTSSAASKKLKAAQKARTRPSAPPAGQDKKKTVTRRVKPTERSFKVGSAVGDILERKVLAAVLRNFKSRSGGRGAGKLNALERSRTTHPAIRKYNIEHPAPDLGPDVASYAAELSEARRALVELGVLASDKSGVVLTKQALEALEVMSDSSDEENLAADYLDSCTTGKDAHPTQTSKKTPRKAPGGRKKREAGSDADADSEDATDAEEEVERGGYPRSRKDAPPPRSKPSGKFGAKKAKQPACSGKRRTPHKRVHVAGADSARSELARQTKAQLIDKITFLERGVANGRDHDGAEEAEKAEGGQSDGEDGEDGEDFQQQLLDLSLVNQHWRKKAIELYNRLVQHVNPQSVDFDAEAAYGLGATDDSDDSDGLADEGLGDDIEDAHQDLRIFDTFVNHDGCATGGADFASNAFGSDDSTFPHLEIDSAGDLSDGFGPADRRGRPDEAPGVASSSSPGKVRGTASSSPARPGSFWQRASSPYTSPPPISVAENALGSLPCLPVLPTAGPSGQKDPAAEPRPIPERTSTGPSEVPQVQQMLIQSLKEELELLQRAYHDKIAAYAHTQQRLEDEVGALRRRLVEFEAAYVGARRRIPEPATEIAELKERIREHHAAFQDVCERERALAAQLAQSEREKKETEIELVSSRADYDGLLAREQRLKESSKRFEVELDKSTTELGRALDERKAFEKRCVELADALVKARKESEKAMQAKERETEALDLCMEARRALFLEMKEKDERAVKASQADQSTIATLSADLLEFQKRVDELSGLKAIAEEAQQCRADAAILKEEVQEKYDDIEGRRARQEGKLSASQCAVTALEAKVVDLEVRKLDAEAASFQARHNTLKWQKEAEEAKEKLHNCECTLEDISSRLELLLSRHERLDAADIHDQVTALAALVDGLRDEATLLAEKSQAHVGLLNFSRSFARDILAQLPGDAYLATDASLEVYLTEVLRGVRDLRADRMNDQTADEERRSLVDAFDKIGRTITELTQSIQSSMVGDDLAVACAQTDSPTPDKLADRLAEVSSSILKERARLCESVEKKEQAFMSSERVRQELGRQLNSMQVEIARVKTQEAAMEDRLRQIRLLASIDDRGHDALGKEASNVAE